MINTTEILTDILNKKLNFKQFLNYIYKLAKYLQVSDFFIIKYKRNILENDYKIINKFYNTEIFSLKNLSSLDNDFLINLIDSLNINNLVNLKEFKDIKIKNSEVKSITFIPFILENERLIQLFFINLKKDLTLDNLNNILLITNLLYLYIDNHIIKKRYKKIITRFFSILESMQEGVLTLDKDFRILNINKAGMKILNLEKEDIIGKFCDEIFIDLKIEDEPNYKGKCYLKYQLTHYKTIKTYYLKFRYIDKFKHIKLIPSIIYEKDQISGFVIVFSDISKEKEIENLKNDIITSVSHELRTPLTSIKGYIDTILHPKATFSVDDIKDFLLIVKHETIRLEKLIKDLLTAAQLEKTKFDLQLQMVNITEVLKEIVNKSILRYKNKFNFIINIENKPLIVQLDVSKFQYCIAQLLNNAIKFSSPLSDIKISLQDTLDKVIISIEDKGIGLDKKEINKIFEKFYRVDKRNTRIAYGLGLGLFITKKIINGHNGQIWVESEKGKGSIFYISLPLVKINDIINL